MNTYADIKEHNRVVDSSIDAINKIVLQNKQVLNLASKSLSSLNDYSSPIQKVGIKMENGEGSNTTLLDSEDQKLYNAFTLMDVLNAL